MGRLCALGPWRTYMTCTTAPQPLSASLSIEASSDCESTSNSWSGSCTYYEQTWESVYQKCQERKNSPRGMQCTRGQSDGTLPAHVPSLA